MKTIIIIMLVGALVGCNQKTDQEKKLEILAQPYTKTIPMPVTGEKMKLVPPPGSTPTK